MSWCDFAPLCGPGSGASGGLLENISGVLRSAIGSADDDDDDKLNTTGDVVDVQSLAPREKEKVSADDD